MCVCVCVCVCVHVLTLTIYQILQAVVVWRRRT